MCVYEKMFTIMVREESGKRCTVLRLILGDNKGGGWGRVGDYNIRNYDADNNCC